MKRILSILLILSMLTACCGFSAHAEDRTNHRDKLSPTLQMRIAAQEAVGGAGAVRDVSYFYNAIQKSSVDKDNPYLYDKIDSKLADTVAAQLQRGEYGTLSVYIDLELDTKLMRDMPSWPDYAAAGREYNAYLAAQSTLYDTTLREITEAVGAHAISDASAVCYEALTARISVGSVVDLALCPQVRSLRLWDPDELNGSKRYDYDDRITGTRYRDRLLSQYSDLHWESKTDRAPLMRYEERCYHMRVTDDKPYAYDWALVEADFVCITNCALYSEYVGGRRLTAPGYQLQPFTFRIGLYDAEQDRFFDLTEIDFDDYPDLYEEFQRLDLGFWEGEIIYGDADGDGWVSVMDATRIQRCLAGLCSRYSTAPAAADVDRDGSVTILDATRIQRYKAGVCELDGSAVAAG